mmetsp:Transcript_4089/g.9915  ORF Transcript_4089/g.9915 Transcript_4089/m.9915 type:complete len:241 (+) Transcript_4089:603-1325(+)
MANVGFSVSRRIHIGGLAGLAGNHCLSLEVRAEVLARLIRCDAVELSLGVGWLRGCILELMVVSSVPCCRQVVEVGVQVLVAVADGEVSGLGGLSQRLSPRLLRHAIKVCTDLIVSLLCRDLITLSPAGILQHAVVERMLGLSELRPVLPQIRVSSASREGIDTFQACCFILLRIQLRKRVEDRLRLRLSLRSRNAKLGSSTVMEARLGLHDRLDRNSRPHGVLLLKSKISVKVAGRCIR